MLPLDRTLQVAGGLQSTGYNIIGNNADAVINSQPTDQIGTPAAPIDPLLGPLADNGGPTLTHALQPGSPAINRGDPAAPPQDQRGYGRLGVPDVGAFEFNGIPPTTLGNISTRAFVQTGDNVMIGGFIVQGTEPKRVIIRAIGPELTQYGVPNVLADPTLELHDGTGALIASNDNWRTTIIGGIITSDQVSDISRSGHAPRDGRESAIIAELPAGNYTAIVRGVNDTMGVALVEAVRFESRQQFNPGQHQYSQLCADGRQRDDWRFYCSRDSTKESDCARHWSRARCTSI